MEHSYVLGPARCISLLVSQTSAAQTFYHRVPVRNQGNKRTAVVGCGYALQGLEAQAAGFVYRFGMDVEYNEKAGNGKLTWGRIYSATLLVASIPQTWGKPSDNFSIDHPALIKDGWIEIRATHAVTDVDVIARVWIYVCDAYLLNDMGDFIESAQFNKGTRRAKRIGETFIRSSYKGGITQR